MIHSIKISKTEIFDLVVCGGGPAGFSTAISAARQGVKTAIVEKLGCLGGVSTSGGINYFLGGRKLNESTGEHVRVVGGIFDEITDRLIAQGDAIEPNTIDPNFNPHGWYPRMASGIVFREQALKILLDELMEENDIRVFYYTSVVDAIVENNVIQSIVVHNKDGFCKLQAPLFADCTGDADLAAFSGCSCSKGREDDGLMTPASLEMQLDGVDGDELVTYQNKHRSPKLVEIIERLKQEGSWPFPYEIFVGMQLVDKDIFLINTIRQVDIDGTSEQSVSRALAQGRKENVALFNIMRKHFPGFKNARIRKICDWVGIRESRRIDGVVQITTENALNGTKHPDCIASTTYNFDLPDPKRPSYDPMMGDAKNPNATRKHIVIQVPYRSLLTRERTNLIVVGRCISAEREVIGAVRIMGPCMHMGMAAGTAAALAIQKHGSFHDVDVTALQRILWANGSLNPNELPFD